MNETEQDGRLAEWDARQPAHERADPLWGLLSYRVARFVLDLAQSDGRDLEHSSHDHRVDQLLGAVGSVSANLAEGYSRLTRPDRARFFGYALGSARESVTWYASLRHVLGEETANERIELISRARRLVYGALKAARKGEPIG